MKYIEVKWIHDFAEEPILMASEVDSQNMEVRKVELFRDGTNGFASAKESHGRTKLGKAPLPHILQINEDPQFVARSISKVEFESMWREANTKPEIDGSRTPFSR